MKRRVHVSSRACLVLVVALAGCGGDDGGDGDCTGRRLTEAQLCTLTCNQSTNAEVQAALGQPQASTGGLLQYNYTCTSGTSASAIYWSFSFTSNVLTDANVTAIGDFAGERIPACLAACHP